MQSTIPTGRGAFNASAILALLAVIAFAFGLTTAGLWLL